MITTYGNMYPKRSYGVKHLKDIRDQITFQERKVLKITLMRRNKTL